MTLNDHIVECEGACKYQVYGVVMTPAKAVGRFLCQRQGGHEEGPALFVRPSISSHGLCGCISQREFREASEHQVYLRCGFVKP